VVVELVGPLVDDRGASGSTISHVLAREGVDLRPGALDQVAGMAPAHALRTLLEGHGRFELLERLDTLLARAAPALESWALSGEARLVDDGARAAWDRLDDGKNARALLTTLPRAAAHRLAERLRLTVAPEEWIVADDPLGPPHPEHVVHHLAQLGDSQAPVALVQSIGAALATASAGCHVVAVGASGGATMFADRQVASLGEFVTRQSA
jgi:beta-phosphoglucomutase-like phosphatase (HAD superfamily)